MLHSLQHLARGHARARAQTARMHLGIFLSMSVILLALIIWFVGELRAAEKEKDKDAKKKE